jgi:gamma-glutamyl-gamma-aminobutyrate hydrolase PuuD
MNSRKVLVVNDKADMGRSYYLPFEFVGPRTDDTQLITSDPESIALVVFTGGSDVNPELYNENVGKYTAFDPYRDEDEFAVFNGAVEHKIPMFGICRGVQFLNVMMGGKLVQHVTGHHQKHKMRIKSGMEFDVSSSHHQMVLPRPRDVILGWSVPRLSLSYLDGDNQKLPPPSGEVEAIKFYDSPACGVQYHPEIMRPESEGFKYVETMIRQHLPTVVG